MSVPEQEQEVPRANQLYGRIVFSWFVSGFAMLFAGFVLIWIEGINVLFPALYPIVGVMLASRLIPESHEHARQLCAGLSAVLLSALLVYLLMTSSATVALALMLAGVVLSIVIPYEWVSGSTKWLLGQRGYEVSPLTPSENEG